MKATGKNSPSSKAEQLREQIMVIAAFGNAEARMIGIAKAFAMVAGESLFFSKKSFAENDAARRRRAARNKLEQGVSKTDAANQLHKTFGVSIRTAWRDLEAITGITDKT